MANAYETWARALRSWATDPTATLDGLPPITAESFNPTVHRRLLKHIERALNIADTRWSEALTNLPATADYHEFERWWLTTRNNLARRMHLCNHPGLPNEIRSTLLIDAQTRIGNWQHHIENILRRSSVTGELPTATEQRIYDLVRSTPLTAVLDPTYGTATRLTHALEQS